MSDEQPEEILTGRASIERNQGWDPLVPADPVKTEDPGLDLNDPSVKHLSRDAEPLEGVEREYYGPDGEPTDRWKSVSPEQAAHDLANARRGERQAREDQGNRDLADALDQLNARDQGQQPAQQDQQPQPETFEPQPETVEADAARAEVDAAWQKADAEISEFLKNPHIRERIQGEYDQIKNAAAAEAKQEVERAYTLSAAVRDHYQQATTNLLNEAGGIIGALFPELQNLSGERLQGALAIMQQTNPQRVQQLQHLASRAQGLVEAQQRQQHEAAQGQALQRDHELQQFTAAEEKRFEEATKYELKETMKRIRESVYDVTEKHYGISKETMQRIYSGEQRVDSAAFVRSAAFGLMLKDAVAYRLSREGITQARSNPIPKVQRPGVASDGPRVHEGDLAAAASRFNLPGGNEGPQGLRNAAAWITAKREARG